MIQLFWWPISSIYLHINPHSHHLTVYKWCCQELGQDAGGCKVVSIHVLSGKKSSETCLVGYSMLCLWLPIVIKIWGNIMAWGVAWLGTATAFGARTHPHVWTKPMKSPLSPSRPGTPFSGSVEKCEEPMRNRAQSDQDCTSCPQPTCFFSATHTAVPEESNMDFRVPRIAEL